MKVLLLGANRFLGRAIIEAAQARGHHVTAFNRGNHPVAPGTAHVAGDRGDVSALRAGTWDVAIDTSGQTPRQVGQSAAALADRVAHYTFLSSTGVYPEPVAPGTGESAPVAPWPAGADPDDAKDLETYGARKALCEKAAESAMPGRVLCVRAGFIVGPYDYSDRFTSWIDRLRRNAPAIVPGDPNQPVQLVDVADLAEWILSMAERRVAGTYNATGPERPLTLIELVRACRAVVRSSSRLVNVPSDVLLRAGVEPWSEIAFWSERHEYGGMQIDVGKAVRAGLRFRPVHETIARTCTWSLSAFHARRVSLSAEKEARVIADFEADVIPKSAAP